MEGGRRKAEEGKPIIMVFQPDRGKTGYYSSLLVSKLTAQRLRLLRYLSDHELTNWTVNCSNRNTDGPMPSRPDHFLSCV